MGCSIKKTSTNYAGTQDYYLATLDFRSLEARLAAQDTVLNAPSGIETKTKVDDNVLANVKGTGMDPVLYELYKPNSPVGEDMHTMTSFNSFYKSVGRKVFDCEDENGTHWLVLDNMPIVIKKRDGDTLHAKDILKYKVDDADFDFANEMIVYGKDLRETDTILRYVD